MKSNQFAFILVFVCGIAFSQEKNNNVVLSSLSAVLEKDSITAVNGSSKWSIQLGSGVAVGSRPYSDGYGLLGNNKVLNGFNFNSFVLGGTYNASKFISYKVDFSFDQINNRSGVGSKPFEVVQYRTNVQGQLNLSRLANLKKEASNFNLLFHGGIQIARLMPIEGTFDKKIKLSTGDNSAGLILGLTPTYRIANGVSVFADLSSITTYGQNLTWNGLGSKVSNNAQGHMYSLIFGLSVGLGKK